MRKVMFVFALLAICACAAQAVVITKDFYGEGWQLVATPCVPFNHGAAYCWDDPNEENWDGWLDARLYGKNPVSGGQTQIDYSDPSAFVLLLGDGYEFNCDGTYSSKSYDCVPNGIPDSSNNMTDIWISLPGLDETKAGGSVNLDAGGWHLIGCPFNHNIPFDKDEGSVGNGDNIFFTDGVTLKTWSEAFSAQWVSKVMYGKDNRGQFVAGFDEDPYSADVYMAKGKGYWLETKKDNLAMIVPAVASWDPETFEW